MRDKGMIEMKELDRYVEHLHVKSGFVTNMWTAHIRAALAVSTLYSPSQRMHLESSTRAAEEGSGLTAHPSQTNSLTLSFVAASTSAFS